jgi:hypothetical protein
MTATKLKSNLFQLVENSKNTKLLSIVYELLSSDKSKKSGTDWWDTLTHEQKAEIEKSLQELQSGQSISHKQVMAKYKGKYC